ncbi:MAG: rhodanese-like domain-containing protein [Desulfobacterales bacterium]|nr:rhodanese-like domain-containing protein [Desulfobacterales bacterium]
MDRAAGLIRDPEVLILDVRTPGEYGRGRIPGSKLIPIRQLQARLDELLPHKDKPILVYCASGNRSTVGSKVLVDQGFARVYNLRRGIKAWQSKGFTMER